MQNDAAGPLLGWSLGSGLERRRFHDLVEFPCTFCFKAVGTAGDDFASAMLERVARALGRDVRDDEHSVRQSAQGNYASVTLKLYVISGDEVYSVYDAIREDERVKFLL
jgi:putative lipoic acid-binding regulatory protein